MPIRTRTVSGVAVLQIDSPPVNALSSAIRADIASAIHEANHSPQVDAIVLCGTHVFSAGADISEFRNGDFRQPPLLVDLFNLIGTSDKPIVAAVDGFALGGGLECILAADARIATARATFGLPEVNLGILPGAGGTQRLTRLIGPAAAIDLMVEGKPIDARSALRIGILDFISENLLTDAIAHARKIARSRERPLPTLQRTDRTQGFEAEFFARTLADVRARSGELAAPPAIVACARAACELPPMDGFRVEQARLKELQDNPQHAALVHMFMAERAAAKSPETKPQRINRSEAIGDRLMQYYVDSAKFMGKSGIDPGRIDRVATRFGMRTGPFALIDRQALDTMELAGVEPLAISDEEILDFLLLPLVNEGAKAVADGTAIRASDIDVALVNGYGFPRHRGGPMFWSRQIGVARIHATIENLGRWLGPSWSPAHNLPTILS